jgi:hypothetical protein
MTTYIGRGANVKFDYHDKARSGRIEKVGNGPNGVYVIIAQDDGTHKTFSQPKISNLRRA